MNGGRKGKNGYIDVADKADQMYDAPSGGQVEQDGVAGLELT